MSVTSRGPPGPAPPLDRDPAADVQIGAERRLPLGMPLGLGVEQDPGSTRQSVATVAACTIWCRASAEIVVSRALTPGMVIILPASG